MLHFEISFEHSFRRIVLKQNTTNEKRKLKAFSFGRSI